MPVLLKGQLEKKSMETFRQEGANPGFSDAVLRQVFSGEVLLRCSSLAQIWQHLGMAQENSRMVLFSHCSNVLKEGFELVPKVRIVRNGQ